jgi:hypothetical protein
MLAMINRFISRNTHSTPQILRNRVSERRQRRKEEIRGGNRADQIFLLRAMRTCHKNDMSIN